MIYLDYNASTPIDGAVREAMLPYLGEAFGNPSSGHSQGRRMKAGVEAAREQVAGLLGAQHDEIVFTSGGTEANNLAIKGVAFARGKDRGHIITSAIEHPAVVNPCRFLEKQGFEVTYIGVDTEGRVDPQRIVEEVRHDTILISVMHANNEVGTIQRIAEIAEIGRQGGILVHSDAAQSCGKIDTNVERLGIDFLTIAGHKMYAPQGIGALYVRRGVKMEPLHHGAGHERGRRAGTEPVAAIVGLGKAAELAREHLNDSRTRLLCERLYFGLKATLDETVVLLGHSEARLPNTLAVGFRGFIGGDILGACPELCASTGAACHSGRPERSATLAAMGVSEEIAFGAIRFSVGRFSTEAEIDRAVEMIARAVAAKRPKAVSR